MYHDRQRLVGPSLTAPTISAVPGRTRMFASRTLFIKYYNSEVHTRTFCYAWKLLCVSITLYTFTIHAPFGAHIPVHRRQKREGERLMHQYYTRSSFCTFRTFQVYLKCSHRLIHVHFTCIALHASSYGPTTWAVRLLLSMMQSRTIGRNPAGVFGFL